jgi:hypothetical protein
MTPPTPSDVAKLARMSRKVTLEPSRLDQCDGEHVRQHLFQFRALGNDIRRDFLARGDVVPSQGLPGDSLAWLD